MRTILVLVIALAGCSKGGVPDWTKRAVKTVSATVKGVAFTIDLPEGMRQKDDGGDVVFDFLIDGRVYTPEFMIKTGYVAKTLDEYVAFAREADNWLRKEALPDGYVVSYENPSYKGKEDYITYVYRTFGDQALVCSARLAPSSRGGKTKDQVPAVEKVCLSLKPAK